MLTGYPPRTTNPLAVVRKRPAQPRVTGELSQCRCRRSAAPPLSLLLVVSTGIERECQQNNSTGMS